MDPYVIGCGRGRPRIHTLVTTELPAAGAYSGARGGDVRVSVVIPALNEEAAIGGVVREIPRDLVDEIIVVDNGSTDRTAEIAAAAGARVVREPRRGYGRAFRAGLRSLSADCEIVVFLDGDGSDYPEMMNRLVEPI